MKLHGRSAAVLTFGCKVNLYDSAKIERELTAAGCILVDESQADLIIVNTCTVTNSSDYQARQLVRKCRRRNPGCTIVITGCYAQVAPQEAAAADTNLIVLGTSEKEGIAQRLALIPENTAHIDVADIQHGGRPPVALEAVVHSKRTRAFLKIQDGCDSFCTYCMIPFARGRSRSATLDSLHKVLCDLSNQGMREVVITGVHIGKYGRDLSPATNFAAVLSILANYPQIRFRLSSFEPWELDQELLTLLSSMPNLCPFLHIPVQSGDDGILTAMGRQYTADFFFQLAAKLKAALPSLCLGSDVIVGFPGEDQASFERTLAFLEACPVDFLHVFPYSPREGTKAFSLTGAVHGSQVRERAARLRQLSKHKRSQFIQTQIGSTLHCLFERIPQREGHYSGYTENYLRIEMKSAVSLDNCLIPLIITGVQPDGTPSATLL